MKRILKLATIFACILVLVLSKENFEREILKKMENQDDETLFKVYHYLYNKKYDINSSEGVRRSEIFKKNCEYIKAENAKGYSYTLGFNHLMDHSIEEIRKMYTNSREDLEWKTLEKASQEEKKTIDYRNFFDTPDDDEVPQTTLNINSSENYKNLFDRNDEVDRDELKLLSYKVSNSIGARAPIDYRSKMTPVRDQGDCGCCWAFSSAAALEANMAIKANAQPSYLSTQQLVDCDTNSSGCDGGWALGALYYYAKTTGLVLENQYPFTSSTSGLTGTCRTDIVSNSNAIKYKSKGTEYCQDCTIDQFYAYLARGPVVISIYAEDNFFYYTSGIWSITSCPYANSNHSMVAVGWGVETVNGQQIEYTIIKNSWGVGWGENGYVRVKYQPELNKSCFVNKRAYLPIF